VLRNTTIQGPKAPLCAPQFAGSVFGATNTTAAGLRGRGCAADFIYDRISQDPPSTPANWKREYDEIIRKQRDGSKTAISVEPVRPGSS